MNAVTAGPFSGLLVLAHALATLALVGCLIVGGLRLAVQGYWPRQLTHAAVLLGVAVLLT